MLLNITIKHENIKFWCWIFIHIPHACFIAVDKMFINSTLKISEEIAECLYPLLFINQNDLTVLPGIPEVLKWIPAL